MHVLVSGAWTSRRQAEPSSKSTQGCGWLPPVAQYQGEAGEDIHFFLSKHPPIASITIDCEKPVAPLKGKARSGAPQRVFSGTLSAGTFCARAGQAMSECFCTGSSSSLGNLSQ